jgi:hypothetical protein
MHITRITLMRFIPKIIYFPSYWTWQWLLKQKHLALITDDFLNFPLVRRVVGTFSDGIKLKKFQTELSLVIVEHHAGFIDGLEVHASMS